MTKQTNKQTNWKLMFSVPLASMQFFCYSVRRTLNMLDERQINKTCEVHRQYMVCYVFQCGTCNETT
jgi:hypothetical protein